jgi:hypothetical protein
MPPPIIRLMPEKLRVVYHLDGRNPFHEHRAPVGVPTKSKEYTDSISKMAAGLALELGLKGSCLDVGPGSNIFVPKAMRKHGLDVRAIDVNVPGVGFPQKGSVSLAMEHYGIKRYHGDVADLNSPGSELRGKKFDFIYFWGSLSSGIGSPEGNFTVQEIADLRGEVREHIGKESIESTAPAYQAWWKDKRKAVLGECRRALAEGGRIAVVSPNFTVSGAGYGTKGHLAEMAEFRETMRDMQALGAKKIHVFGFSPEMSRKEIDRALERDMPKIFEEIRTRLPKEEAEKAVKQLEDGSFDFSEENVINFIHKVAVRGTFGSMIWMNRLDSLNAIHTMKKGIAKGGKKAVMIHAIAAEF